ncbi:MAG TPA: glycogen/starch synthase [Gemmatimonadaceae bacterium]|nr:glycogen/starch synthase [Gemmatimonadaceae bacterium]
MTTERRARAPARAEAARATPPGEAPSNGYPLVSERSGKHVTVVHLAAELAPFARTGGLGEAVSSLAHYQALTGLKTIIVMPLYRQVTEVATDLEPVGGAFPVIIGPRTEEARLYESRALRGNPAKRKPRILFVQHAGYFDRDQLYGDSHGDYPDNHRRFSFFCLAALNALPSIATAPIILHAHDWHTALAPVYLRVYDGAEGRELYQQTSSVLTVHNAGFQGHFAPDVLPELGLPWELYNWHQLEWYGRANMLKGGMAFADAVTTVSPSHAHELRTPAGGFGLHGAFLALRDRFVGIVNGIDQHQWNPETDKEITARYSKADLSGKKRCKAALQRLFGLPQRARTPILGMSARMVYQKGLDLILGSPRFLSLDAQFLFLGQGEKRYVDILTELARRAPGRIGVQTNFTSKAEHKLMAGADMIIMPSQYEPCGLTQMRAQRYGALPVARRVGGLADTIEDGVTGFLFDAFTTNDFLNACVRAIDHYNHPEVWQKMQQEAMSRDFGWERSEQRYLELYRRVLASPRTSG